MRKLYKLLLMMPAMFFMSGCYDLDRYPQDQLSSGTFWQTDEQAEEGVLGVYPALKYGYVFGIYYSMDCVSDLGWGYDDNVGMQSIVQNSYNANSGHVKARWQHTYDAIKKANVVIRNVKASEQISEGVKKEVIAEARFLRALFYFHLTNFFGGVPIYNETVDYDMDYMNLQSLRASEEAARDFIISDLTAAINDLPVNWEDDNYGRATKGAAYALRGKVYLFEKEYDKAIEDFEEIVLDPEGRGYGYGLYSDYAGLFTQEGDASNEMIFAIQNYTAVGFSLGMSFDHYIGNQNSFGFGWNNVMPSVELADSYELKNGKLFNWNDFIPEYNEDADVRKNVFVSTLTSDKTEVENYPVYYNQLLDMYSQRDPRMAETLILPYTHYLGGDPEVKDCEFVFADGVSRNDGFVIVNRYGNYDNLLYLFRKFVPVGDMNGQLTQKSDRDYAPINFPIIRYADVLLMLAECYNEKNNVDEAVKYINMVRARPSTDMPAINNGQSWMEARTKDEVFKRIMHERGVELVLEGHRYCDLKRWGLLDEVLSKPIADIGGTTIMTRQPFRDQLLYWPIPSEARDRNPNLEQNPGW